MLGSCLENVRKAVISALFDANGAPLDSMHIRSELGERYLASVDKAAEEGPAEKLFPMSLQEDSAGYREYPLRLLPA